MTNREMDNLKRTEVLNFLKNFLENNGEEVLQTNSNEIVFPYCDEEKNEKWVQIVVKIPKGGRDENGFDGYGLAESYQIKLKERKEKEEKKKKKIEKDKKKREEKTE